MIRNYLASFRRFIARNSFHSVLNISGLIIGTTTFLLLMQYIFHEYSYDDFLQNSGRIYRIQQDRFNNGEISTQWAAGCAGIGPALKANLPEVEKYVRLRGDNAIFSVGDARFREENIYYASEDFFNIFSIPLLKGTDSVALSEPNTIVLSASIARKYFHDKEPVGEIITVNGNRDLKVTGIFMDLPENTHMKFDALISFATYASFFDDPSDLDTWNWDAFMTYVLLNKNSDPQAFETKIADLVEKLHGEEMRQYNAWIEFHLQPVRDIHLDSSFMFEFQPNGNRRTVQFLLLIAILIMIIAWINYINLSTAKSVERAREVGIRKVMGSAKGELILQFMTESLLLNTFAVLISLLLMILLSGPFSSLSGRELDNFLLHKSFFWIGLILMIILGAVVSGIYPAIVLSSHKPVSVLKGRIKSTSGGILLRKGLVILQFGISIALITGTFIIYRQVHFLQDQQLGVNIDQTLVLKSPGIVDSTYQKKYGVFKHRLLQYSEVTSVTASTEVPGRQPGWNAGGIRRLSQREDETNQYRIIMMDEDFMPSFGLEVIAGRPFSGELSHEERNVLMNEAACRLIGFSEPDESLNDRIFFWGDTFRIIGVVKNYAQESLKKTYDPMIFRYSAAPGGYYSVKFNTSNVKSSMSGFENEWKEIFPGNPFEYFFLDDHYNSQYKADKQFGSVFGIFSSLAIFIACLGLIGLTSLSVVQRTKEIGIRKVLGASIYQIISLMGREYLVLMGISVMLAVPVSGWVMGQWLQAFASRIDLAWWVFVIPCLGVIGTAFLAIGFHTVKAAATDPVTTLRYE